MGSRGGLNFPAVVTGSEAQTLNMPLACPDGVVHDLVPLYCPHSTPHSDPPTTPDGEDVVAGQWCLRCDGMWMYEPWCNCQPVETASP